MKSIAISIDTNERNLIMDDKRSTPDASGQPKPEEKAARKDSAEIQAGETGGPKGPEPTRYGDWEKKGRCIDF
jgi:hypothetical protein